MPCFEISCPGIVIVKKSSHFPLEYMGQPALLRSLSVDSPFRFDEAFFASYFIIHSPLNRQQTTLTMTEASCR